MKINKPFIIILILLSLILLSLILTFSLVSAQSDIPKGYVAFYPSENLVCLDKEGEFLGCWCCPDDEDCKFVDPTPKPTKKVDPTETSDPTSTPQVEPTETPKPEPTEKPNCNAGRGNGSEGDPDCDPGNSGGKNQGGD